MAETDGPAAAAPNDTVWPGNLLDAANRAIIEALQRDGRQPYGAIAEEVGLSEAAVRRRVQRLREAGIMQIVAVTDPSWATCGWWPRNSARWPKSTTW